MKANLETRIAKAKSLISALEKEATDLQTQKDSIHVDTSVKYYQYSKSYAAWRSLDSKIRKIERQIEDLKYDTVFVRSLMNSVIKDTVKSLTTAVKGYHMYTDGKKVGAGWIEVRGNQFSNKIGDIKSLLLSNGYTIKNEKSSYHWSSGWQYIINYNSII